MAGVSPSPAHAQTPPPATGATLSPEQAVQADLDHLSAALGGRGSTQSQRDEAARRLLSRGSTPAIDILLQALKERGHDPALAVARALADDPRPDPRFIEPLESVLGTEPNLHEAAARALAQLSSNDSVRARLISFARDTHQPAATRLAVIHALGSVVDRDVAQTLLDLLTDETLGGPPIQNAAADALGEMTGLTENARNSQRWHDWFASIAAKKDSDWKAAVYPGRAARLESAEQKYNHLANELDSILTEQYQSAPTAKEKNAAVMRYLNSPEADVRLIGTRIVRDGFLNTGSVPQQAPDRLKELVGDSDRRVRLEVARTLKTINYQGAQDAMLTQLSQEQDPDVKTALIGAVAQIGGIKSVPLLRRLLHDPSLRVAAAAADSIRSLGPAIFKGDPKRATEIAQELWALYQQHSQEPGAVDFSVTALQAIGPLRDTSLVIPLTKLLDNAQPERIRGAALRAIGDIGDPHAFDPVNLWLGQEPSPNVRIDAIDALGKTGSFSDDAITLYGFFGPRSQEPSSEVRQRAWLVFQNLLPTASKESLATWAQRLNGDPARLIDLQQALNSKLQKDGDLEQLAYSQQSTGETLLRLNRPQDAVTNFQAALDYWEGNKNDPSVTDRLVGQLMDALLQSRQYQQAAVFAGKEIAANRAQQETMGSKIENEADRLLGDADKKNDTAELKDALNLISEAMKIKPALDQRYQLHLTATQKQAQERLGAQ